MLCEYCSKPLDLVPIVTRCGYVICKSHLDSPNKFFECNMCNQVHSLKECLNLEINKRNFKEQELKIISQEFEQKVAKFEQIRKEPVYFLNENYESVLRQVDLRREEVKLELEKMVDQYYNDLIEKIESDKKENLEKIQNIFSDLENSKKEVEFSFSNTTSVRDFEEKEKNLKESIKNLDLVEEIIQKPKKLELKSQDIKVFNIQDFFGHLDYKKEDEMNFKKLSDDFNGNCIKKIQGHRYAVSQIIPLDDTNELVSCSFDSKIKIWNLETGECKRTLEGHSWGVLCIQVVDDKIISGSGDNTIKIWDKNSGQLLRTLKGHSHSVISLIARSDQIISGSQDFSIRIWKRSKGKCLKILEQNEFCSNALIYLNSNQFISACTKIKIWDIERGVCIKTIQGKIHGQNFLQVNCLSLINPNELASGLWNGMIKIWNLSTGDCIKTLEAHKGCVNCLEVVEKDLIISGSKDKTIKIWNLKEGIVSQEIHFDHEVLSLNVLKSGNLIASFEDSKIQIFS